MIRKVDFNYKKNDLLEISNEIKLIFESLDKGVMILNSLGKVIYVNNIYEKYFSIDRNDILEKSIFSISTDNIILKSYKDKTEKEGYINYSFENLQLFNTSTPIFDNNEFKGIIASYNKKEVKKVIKMNNTDYKNKAGVSIFSSIIGQNQMLIKELRNAKQVAKTDASVLIKGESGTGKGLLAKEIHNHSKRKDKPFVVINAGAIPDNLIESELFGHKKGSFTGAIENKIGKFEMANGGTIFLDEIGDLPLNLQVKLLRVLQTKRFVPVGSNEEKYSDVRIIAATHRNLEKMMKQGSFRQDLFYRLNIVPISVPALRERKDDIKALIDHYRIKISKSLGIEPKKISKEVINILKKYDWPGNIRELKNLLKRIIILSSDEKITLKDIPEKITKIYNYNKKRLKEESLIRINKKGEIASFEEYEKDIIEMALKKYGNFHAASKYLKINHKTVASKARKYNIKF